MIKVGTPGKSSGAYLNARYLRTEFGYIGINETT
jgi:hypothetical protein